MINLIKENIYIVKKIFITNPLFILIASSVSFINGLSIGFVNVIFLRYLFDLIQKTTNFKYFIVTFFFFCIYLIVTHLIYSYYEKYYKDIQIDKINSKFNIKLFSNVLEYVEDIDEIREDFLYVFKGLKRKGNSYIDELMSLIFNIAMLLTVVIFMISMKQMFFILVIAFQIVFFFIENRIASLKAIQVLNEKNFYKKNEYIDRVFSLKEFASELRILNLKNVFLNIFEKNMNEIVHNRIYWGKKIFYYQLSMELLKIVFLHLLLPVYAVYELFVKRSITLGGFAAIMNSIGSIVFNTANISRLLKEFSESSIYIKKYRQLTERAKKEEICKKKIEHRINKIALNNVSYKYENQIYNSLNGVSITLHKKQFIALVGENGSGKTTLIKLILGLLKPTDGQVTINDIDLMAIDNDMYHNKIGSVFQEFNIYAVSVMENVTLNLDNADKELVTRALDSVDMLSIINDMAMGINTELTREYDDKGVNLSEGQIQKIVVSRIFYGSFDLVILDEPTSSLDPSSEYNLLKKIKEFFSDSIIILITHRLSAVIDADQILFVKEGRISESGNHEELMKLNGNYKKLFDMQASKYF